MKLIQSLKYLILFCPVNALAHPHIASMGHDEPGSLTDNLFLVSIVGTTLVVMLIIRKIMRHRKARSTE